MRIGILGGSFNPVHIGHLLLAQYALEALKLDKLFFIPACLSPLKRNKRLISGHHRLAMLKIATRANKKFLVSDSEIKRGGKSYTVETLRQFKQRFKHSRLFFITGSDSLLQLNKWRDLDKILKLATFVVAIRPGFEKNKSGLKLNFKYIDMPRIDISSSRIRARLKSGKAVGYEMPAAVSAYIKNKGLYR